MYRLVLQTGAPLSAARRLISFGLLLAGGLGGQNPRPQETVKQQAAQALGDLPLVFEPNLGQTDSRVRFLTRAAGMTSFLTDQENVIALSRRNGADKEQTVVRIELDGARAPRSFEGIERAGSISNTGFRRVSKGRPALLRRWRQARI
jgi:hypothetical protein